jgi:hypothetical protein
MRYHGMKHMGSNWQSPDLEGWRHPIDWSDFALKKFRSLFE